MSTSRPLGRALCCAFLALVLTACGGGGGGGGGGATNAAPQTSVSFGKAVHLGLDSQLHATVGELIELNGSASSDPDGDTLSFTWTLVARPTGSSAALQGAAVGVSSFIPDVSGAYTVRLTVDDRKGGTQSRELTLLVDNLTPVATVVVTATFEGDSQTLAAQSVSTRTLLSLDSSASTDANGGPLVTTWSLVERPAGSAAQVSAATGAVTTLLVDSIGTYRITGRVTDNHGAWVERSFVFVADNRVPTADLRSVATFQGDAQTLPSQRLDVGASVAFSSASSTDAEGQALSTSWTWVERPLNSTAALSAATGTSSGFVPDVLGTYRVKGRVTDTRGAWAERTFVFLADNRPPNAVTTLSVTPTVAETQSSQTASLGYDLLLGSQSSTDADGDVLQRAWTLVARPGGSAAALSTSTQPTTVLVPDVLGTYQVRLTVTDTRGAASSHLLSINVNNHRPVAQIGTNATPNALPSAPASHVPLGTQLTLRGGDSLDADGDALTYSWSMPTRPAGSTAAFSSAQQATTLFTPDVNGTYVALLRVTDTQGAYSERSVTLVVGNQAPVLQLSRTRMAAIRGDAVNLSAALSYDPDGQALTYAWAIDSAPAGSTAALSGATTSAASFTPDQAGTYIVNATISDGLHSVSGQVVVAVRVPSEISVALDFTPLRTRYSKSLDLLVASAAGPDSLRIVDPVTQSVRAVPMPKPISAFNLSPDGRYAIVAQDALLTLVDVAAASVVRHVPIDRNPVDVFLTNDRFAYPVGGMSWGGNGNDFAYGIFDMNTGAGVPSPGYFWQVTMNPGGPAAFLPNRNRVLYVWSGSPADIAYFEFSPTTHAIVSSGDSPYHGDYPMMAPLWVSDDQARVYTASGNLFAASTLAYGGSLSGSNWIQSLSDSTAQAEVLALPSAYAPNGGYNDRIYSDKLRRYSYPYLTREADQSLPLIGGQTSYGVEIFHSGQDKQVLLLQVGSDRVGALNVTYHAVWR